MPPLGVPPWLGQAPAAPSAAAAPNFTPNFGQQPRLSAAGLCAKAAVPYPSTGPAGRRNGPPGGCQPRAGRERSASRQASRVGPAAGPAAPARGAPSASRPPHRPPSPGGAQGGAGALPAAQPPRVPPGPGAPRPPPHLVLLQHLAEARVPLRHPAVELGDAHGPPAPRPNAPRRRPRSASFRRAALTARPPAP